MYVYVYLILHDAMNGKISMTLAGGLNTRVILQTDEDADVGVDEDGDDGERYDALDFEVRRGKVWARYWERRKANWKEKGRIMACNSRGGMESNLFTSSFVRLVRGGIVDASNEPPWP